LPHVPRAHHWTCTRPRRESIGPPAAKALPRALFERYCVTAATTTGWRRPGCCSTRSTNRLAGGACGLDAGRVRRPISASAN